MQTTKRKTKCKECIYATTDTVKDGEMCGTTELRCHKQQQTKNGIDTCDEGKHRNEEGFWFTVEQADFD